MSDNDKPSFETARLTLALNNESPSASDPMQAAEARMRRALGLSGEQLRARSAPERTEPAPRPIERFSPNGHKRRFVHDGEVPVTVVHGLVAGRRDHHDGNGRGNGTAAPPTNRLEVAEAALAAEIANRERIERALQEAQTAAHDLRTKLGHAQLAHQEAVETLRREREATAALRATLAEAETQAANAQAARDAAEQALAALRQSHAEGATVVAEPVVKPRRGRPPRIASTAIAPAVATPAVVAPAVVAAAAPADVPVKPRRGRPPRKAAVVPAEMPVKPRRGRPPRAASAALAETKAAAPTPRKRGRPPREAEAASAREPKPIRWWLAPRGKKKR